MRTWLACIDAEYPRLLNLAEQEMSPILHYATEHAGLLSATLYACPATYTAEEPLELYEMSKANMALRPGVIWFEIMNRRRRD